MKTKYVFAALVLATSATAVAGPEIGLELAPQEDPKKDAPPDIIAKVISGAAAPDVAKISLVQTDPKTPIEIKATELKTYVQGDETLGLVVVFEGHFIWVGDDSYSENATKYEGVYKALSAAIDKLNTAGPARSKATVVWYGAGAQTRWSGELKDLTGDKLGSQKDIGTLSGRPVINRDLVAGIDEGITQLNKMGTSRKFLVVIGDGMNTNQEAGAAELADRKKKLAGDGITAWAIIVNAPIDLDGDPASIGKMVGANKKVLDGVDGLAAAVGSVADAINDRYYVRIPGADLKLRKSFEWDEKPHTFLLKVDKDEFEIDEIVLAPKWTPPWKRGGGGFPWLAVIGVILGIGLIVVIGVMVFRKKPAPEPLPVPMPAAAPAPVAAPAGPMKTVMMGIGGDDQGFPIVGWIVPLNGPNQFQTFKLQGGVSKIGTGGGANVVINDGFMSTEHCQIVASPAGFTLVDGGSTNGTYVNDRKVQKHELVDNDVIMMGKTSFRFKSIN